MLHHNPYDYTPSPYNQPYEIHSQQQPYHYPQTYQPYYDPRVPQPAPTPSTPSAPTTPTPSAPTISPGQIQILPPSPTTPVEPTAAQIQQVVGTQFLSLKNPVLNFVKPWVQYGMNESKYTSVEHAMTEVAAIMFLIGKGFNPTIAHYIVESWEKNEQF